MPELAGRLEGLVWRCLRHCPGLPHAGRRWRWAISCLPVPILRPAPTARPSADAAKLAIGHDGEISLAYAINPAKTPYGNPTVEELVGRSV